jgi:uncharacterized UPF0146 family protein
MPETCSRCGKVAEVTVGLAFGVGGRVATLCVPCFEVNMKEVGQTVRQIRSQLNRKET